MDKKIVYLANSYGFSKQQNALLKTFKEIIADLGAIVWEPFERNAESKSLEDNAYAIMQKNTSDVRNSDGIFAIVNGAPPDEGVMVEIGMAIAWNKEIFLFRDDFRECSDSKEYPLNLMIFAGLQKKWENYYYTAIEDIENPDKAFYKWLK